MPLLASAALLVILIFIPTGFEDKELYRGCDRCVAEVLTADDSTVISNGLIHAGEEYCTVRLLGGMFRGRIVPAVNFLSGSMSQDKMFAPGDRALVVISHQNGEILSVNMIDHYRVDRELLLAGIFVIFLILFAGWSGVRAALSFAVTILAIWKLLVPSALRGANPIVTGILVMILLTACIIALVYGFDRRFLTATLGSLLGTGTACVLGILFTGLFRIHGAVMTFSETLLYCGYSHLNLTRIFMAGIFIGASGAMMDLAVDITSAVYEVVQKKPEIGRKEAVLSGFHIGKAAMGTMTTTLLLAYSGGYLALLMVFMAQGTPVWNILNLKYVASEIMYTIIGSFGLVSVAPFTAVVSGLLLTNRSGK